MNKIKKLTNSLSEKFDVVTYSFGSQFREKIVFDFKDKVTDFSSLFDELQTRYSDRNLGAIIVASDGIFNQGQSPVYSSSRIKAPIFCISMGDTTIYQDLILTKVIHNKIAFLGNTFPLDVIVDAHQCQNTTSILTIRKGQQIVFTKSLNIPTNNFNLTLPVELTAASIGLQHYTVSLSVLDGEHNKLNNILETLETLQKNYVEITQIYDVQEQFLLQLDKMQHIILDNFNKHIKNKIYIADNFTKLTDADWKIINKTSKEKINEWLELTK